MPLFLDEINEHYRLGIWKMEENEQELLTILEKTELFIPYSLAGKRIEYLSVRVLAKHMGLCPDAIGHHPSGKPYLTDRDTTISISHTKGYAAILLSELPNTGVDIEQKGLKILKVRNKFIRPDEAINIPTDEDAEIQSLLLHWSAKESLFKSIPDEGVDFIRELQITDFKYPLKQGMFHATAIRTGVNFQVDYRIYDDFVCTACFALTKKQSTK